MVDELLYQPSDEPQDLLSQSGDKELFLVMKENKQDFMSRQISLTFNSSVERGKVVDRLANQRLSPLPKPAKNLKL